MKKLSPQQATTEKQILSLKRDNIDTPDFWFLVDTHRVYITQQRTGQEATATIEIPRNVFNRFVKFYVTPQ